MLPDQRSDDPFSCLHPPGRFSVVTHLDSTGPNGSCTKSVGNLWGVPRDSIFCREIRVGEPELPNSSIQYKLWETVNEVRKGDGCSSFTVEITARSNRTGDEKVDSTLRQILKNMEPAVYITSAGAVVFHYIDTDRQVIALLGINRKGIDIMPGHQTLDRGLSNVWQILDDCGTMARIIKNDKLSTTTLEALIYVEIEGKKIPVVFGISFSNDAIEEIIETIKRVLIAHAHDRILSSPNMLRHILDPYLYCPGRLGSGKMGYDR